MVHIRDTSPEGFTPLTEVIANRWKLGVRRDTVMLEWSFGNVNILMLRNAALDVGAPEESPPSFEAARGVLYCWPPSIPGLRTYELQYFYALIFDDELVNRSHEAELDTLKLAAVLKSWFKHVGNGEEALSIKL